MRNIELLVDPIEITLGAEADLPEGTRVIKPNIGAAVTVLKKTGDTSKNYAATWTRAFTTDNYFYIGCGGAADATWKSAAGSGTIVCFK